MGRRAVGAFSLLVLCGLSNVSSASADTSVAAPSADLSSAVFLSTGDALRIAVNEAENDTKNNSLLLEEALLVAERIEAVEHKSIALAGIAKAYAELEDFDRADELLGQALQDVEQVLNPSAGQRAELDTYLNTSKVLNRIAVGYFAIGERSRAVALLGRSLAALGEIRSGTSNYEYLLEIIDLYVQFGALSELEDAARVADEIDHTYRRGSALEKIAIAYAQLEDKTLADAGITRMQQRLQGLIDSLPEQSYAFQKTLVNIAIAEARALYGDTEAALSLLEPVIEPDSGLYLLSKAASVCGLMPDKRLAKRSLDELAVMVEETIAEEMADSDDWSNNRVATVSAVVSAYVELEEMTAAQDFLKTVVPEPLALYSPGFDESGFGVSVLGRLANVYEQVGDVETQQALLVRTFDLYVPDELPDEISGLGQLEPWQALMFERMAQSYVQLSPQRAPEGLSVLLQVAGDDWVYSFTTYLATLAQAELERGDWALMQQRLDEAIALLDFYEYGTSPGAGFGRLLRTLTMMAEVYAMVPDEAVKREGLRSLSQAAEGLAVSGAQQRLLGAIALAYSL